MKFRYILKNKNTGEAYKKIYTLNQIQKKGLSALFDLENYEIISVDLFVGLKDKNGIDIFQKDIVSHRNWSNRVVEYQNKYCRFILIDSQKREMKINDFEKEFIEVIGNAVENKELLKN